MGLFSHFRSSSLLRNYGIVLPSDLAILIKTMIECEATTDELDPTSSMLSLVSELGTYEPAPRSTSPEAPLGESSDQAPQRAQDGR
jgi:hypothetical protein